MCFKREVAIPAVKDICYVSYANNIEELSIQVPFNLRGGPPTCLKIKVAIPILCNMEVAILISSEP